MIMVYVCSAQQNIPQMRYIFVKYAHAACTGQHCTAVQNSPKVRSIYHVCVWHTGEHCTMQRSQKVRGIYHVVHACHTKKYNITQSRSGTYHVYEPSTN
jgi:hypothetical protein